jgi:hypothetical protein
MRTRTAFALLAMLFLVGVVASQQSSAQQKKSLKQSWDELMKSAKELRDAVKSPSKQKGETKEGSQPAATGATPAAAAPTGSSPVQVTISLDEFTPENWKHGAMWAPGPSAPLPTIAAAAAAPAPLELPERFDVNQLARVDVIAAITAAKEAMRVMMGPLAPVQEQAFELRWAPYYEYPAEPVLAYLEKLNPLLNEFLAVRAALVQAITGFDAAWEQAMAAAGAGDEEDVWEAMELARFHHGSVEPLQAQLVGIAQQIDALGDLPNPLELKAAARRRHREVTAQIQKAVGNLPPPVKEVAAQTYWVLEKVEQHGGQSAEAQSSKWPFTARHGYVAASWIMNEKQPGGSVNTYVVAGEVKWQPPPALLAVAQGVPNIRTEFPASARCTKVSLDGIPPGNALWLQHCGILQASLNTRAISTSSVAATPGKPVDEKKLTFIHEVDRNAQQAVLHFEVSVPGAQVTYIYSYRRATLNQDQIAEIRRKEEEQRAQLAAGQAAAAAAQAEQAALNEAKVRAIALHRENQAYFARRDKEWEQAMTGATPEQREQLRWQRMAARANLAAEKDLEQMVETGQWRRTRTEFDDWNLARMAAQGREMAKELEYRQRVLGSYERMVNMLPPAQRSQEKKRVLRALDETLRKGDNATLRQAMEGLHGQVTQYWNAEGAKAAQEAERADTMLRAAEAVKSGADNSLMVLSFAGTGGLLYAGYLGATGYIEGGPRQVVLQVVSGLHPVSAGVIAAYQGYHTQVIDENTGEIRNAGASGALWATGRVAINALIARKVIGPLVQSLRQPQAPRTPLERSPTVEQQLAQAKFESRMANGRAKVKLFQQRSDRLADAMRKNAKPNEIARLREQAAEAAKVIKCDYAAKTVMNQNARAGDSATLTRYLTLERQLMDQVRQNFQQQMTKDGWAPQQIRQFSNSASKGKAGMDVDLGLVEPPKYIRQPDNKLVFNPQWWEWKKGLTRNGERRSIFEFQQAGQKNLEASFDQVFGGKGRSTSEAFVNFTTSAHKESYRDLALLGKPGTSHADFEMFDRGWLAQAGDVTAFKINHAAAEMPAALKFQEDCRTLVKDMNTKLIGAERAAGGARDPIHSAAPLARMNQGMQDHVLRLRAVMDDFANNRIGPIEAQRRIRDLTGGEGMPAVVETFQNTLASARMIPTAPARPVIPAKVTAPPKGSSKPAAKPVKR